MFESKFLDEIVTKVSDSLPLSVNQVKQDIEQNIRSILQSAFANLNLVTREEFDVQAALLAKTTEKLIALEQQIKMLEEAINK